MIKVTGRQCQICGASEYEAYDKRPGTCAPCVRARSSQWYRDNKPRVLKCRAKRSQWMRTNEPRTYWVRRALSAVQVRSKERGWSTDIDQEYLQSIAPDVCPVLGIPIDYTRSSVGDDSPSVDRLDSSIGYVRGNVSVISNKANRLKGHGTLTELKSIVAWWEEREREALLS